MKKLLPLTALALVLTGGVALADRGHDNHRGATVEHRGGDRGSYRNHNSTYRDHGNRNNGRWNRGNTVVIRDNHHRGGWNGGNRVVFRNDHYRHNYRRPIYVARPIIHQRYYNYYRRPSVIVENYAPQTGYTWVAGAWAWSGAEWIWQPGHYEPDASYIDQGYSDNGDGYDNSY